MVMIVSVAAGILGVGLAAIGITGILLDRSKWEKQ